MTIKIKFFSMLKDKVGTDEKVIALGEPETARGLFLRFFDAGFLPFTRFAVNWEYVSPDTFLKDGDELAFIPPVSGG